MFGLTAPELARTQFGFTIAFHIIFLAVTIWALSMLALGAVAGLLRIMMACAGLTL
jgi:cytochrome bd-type quinol oxidase subunit 1